MLVVAAGGQRRPRRLSDRLARHLERGACRWPRSTAELARYPGVAITGAVISTGLNANEVDLASPITGELVNAGWAATPADYTAAAGKIALTVRGVCDRTVRAKLGQQAGARAVIMINNSPGCRRLEGPIAGVTIPFVGVDGDDSAERSRAVGEVITLAGRRHHQPGLRPGRAAQLERAAPTRQCPEARPGRTRGDHPVGPGGQRDRRDADVGHVDGQPARGREWRPWSGRRIRPGRRCRSRP